jgi:outer membrane protein TolC
VALLAGYTRTNHVPIFAVPGPGGIGVQVIYPDVPDNYRTRVDLQWPIYSGGRTDALERAAAADAAAATSEVLAAQHDLRLEVTRAYWALATADATVTVLDRSLARARAQVADIRERFDAGLVPPNEIAAGEARESRQRMLLIEATNQRAVSSAELAYLVGAPVTQRVEPADALELAPDLPASLEALVAEARATRDERRGFEHRVEAAVQQQRAIEAGRRPTIATAAGFDLARPNPRIFPRAEKWNDSWDAGVAVTWPLWDGGRVRAQALQAASAVVAAQASLAEFDAALPLEVQQRLLEIDSGRAAVAAADEAIRAAAEALRVVGERYRAGVIAQGEVRDADLDLLQAELDRTRAIAGVRLAEARLARALGR